MALITCRNVSFAYEKNIVLSDVNFSVNMGDYLCIVGENGSGKSTLVKGLLNLKDPLNGTIAFGDGLRADQIGYLPQQNESRRDFPASVFEVVLSGRLNRRRFHPFYNNADKKAAFDALKEMGMEDFCNHRFQDLSGGQQQRVQLARALCATDRMLLLDEPVAGLDPKVASNMYSIIEKINSERKITIIMISHDIRLAVRYASHMLHLGKRQAFFGTTEEYVMSDLSQAFLGGGIDD